MNVQESVVGILQRENIHFEVFHHEPVYTMEQAALVSGHKPEEGIKTLLIRTYKTKSAYDFALVVWRGDRQVNWSRVSDGLRIKKVSMASEEEVEQILGIKIGALTPFGYIQKLPVIFDKAILENITAYINPGRHDETLQLASGDLFTAIHSWLGHDGTIVMMTSSD